MLKERLLTVAVLLPLLLGLMFYAPNPVWGAATGIVMVAAAVEWARLCRLETAGQAAFATLVAASGAAWLAAGAMPQWQALRVSTMQSVLAFAVLFWAAVAPFWLYFGWRVTQRAALLAVGWIVLVPAWLSATVLQRTPLLLFLALSIVWLADTAAYFAGRRFGRHKLAPRISPGKTVEGLIGAYALVLVYVSIVSVALQPAASGAQWAALLVFALVLTTLSVGGDLFESWMKRQAGAKDSGRLLPGHGGVLDRIDSLSAAMPFAALYLHHAAR
jgi:phosphatidate cytidylyltransferase